MCEKVHRVGIGIAAMASQSTCCRTLMKCHGLMAFQPARADAAWPSAREVCIGRSLMPGTCSPTIIPRPDPARVFIPLFIAASVLRGLTQNDSRSMIHHATAALYHQRGGFGGDLSPLDSNVGARVFRLRRLGLALVYALAQRTPSPFSRGRAWPS